MAEPRTQFDLGEGRRGEILTAALEVFSAAGYDGGSMRVIASRVGVSEPALYRHFASKEELFLELMAAATERMRAVAFAVLDSIDPKALPGQIVDVFRQHRPTIVALMPALRTLLVAASHNPVFLDAYRAALVLPAREKLRETVVRIDAGLGVTATSEETDSRVRALMALFIGFAVTTTVLQDEPEQAIAEAVMRMMRWDECPPTVELSP